MERTEYVISLKDLFSKGVDNADKAAARLENRVMSLQGMLGRIGTVVGVGALAKGIFDAGTNMEGLNISLQTMLGNKDEADKLVAQMVKFAATTPFAQSEVQTAGKQLLAYGIEAKNIIPTLRQLGDVSAGLNQPIGEIAYLYGTIKTQGKAMTVDIKQFANRGIPIYEALAAVTGKNGEALQEFIEHGKVGFPQIQKAFELMTTAGSGLKTNFAGLTQELAKTTGGQWSNMKDQLEQLAVTIFKELQPAINWFIKSMASLIEKVKSIIKWIKEHETLVKTIAYAMAAAVVAYKACAIATALWTSAQLALNVAMSANPIGVVIVAVAALTAGIYALWEQYEKLKAEYVQAGENQMFEALKDEIALVKDGADKYEKLGKARKEAESLAIKDENVRIARDIAKMEKQLAFEKRKGSDAEIQTTEKQLGLLKKFKERLPSVFDKSTKKGESGKIVSAGVKGAAGIDSAKTPQHTVITINIDKMIEKFTILTNNVSEGAQSIKETIVKAMIEAVNDSQIVAGQ
jgi:tape measure domain-containing protein